MRKKSDRGATRRISATKASRSFSSLLDQVEAGKRFVIHRHGEDVCLMAPPSQAGRTTSECLRILRGRSPITLDDRFAKDLLAILVEEPIEDRPTWGS